MSLPIKRGRYTCAEEIMLAIGKVNRRILRLRLAGEELNAKADGLRLKDAQVYISLINAHRKDAEKKFERAVKLETKSLLYLKKKLATFQTATLPGVDIDNSIPK